MNTLKLTLAALILGSALTPALAEPGDLSQSPVSAYLQSLGQTAAAPKLIEGRQATAIAAPAPASAVDTFLETRNGQDQDR